MAPKTSATADDRSIANDDRAKAGPRRKRKAADDGEDAADSQRRASKRFQYLKPRTKRISQHLISHKWAPLPAPAQLQVRNLFSAAKRPVVLSRRDERQRREAEAVLEHAVRRLEKQLPRMPFPPKSKDVHFDLDKLVARNHMLESQVTPALHSIELLKAEIEREERAFARDREGLGRLEKNARAERRDAEKQAKKIHPLLEAEGGGEAEDTAELVNLRNTTRRDSALEDSRDPDLQPLLEQFKSHLESMHANTEQMHAFGRVVANSDAVLGGLFPRRRKQ